jgi:hypothetical protein
MNLQTLKNLLDPNRPAPTAYILSKHVPGGAIWQMGSLLVAPPSFKDALDATGLPEVKDDDILRVSFRP